MTRACRDTPALESEVTSCPSATNRSLNDARSAASEQRISTGLPEIRLTTLRPYETSDGHPPQGGGQSWTIPWTWNVQLPGREDG